MSRQPELKDIARVIIDANLYMTLGTVGDDGSPWVTPVYYSVGEYTAFYWVSSPETTHSRNIAARPDVSIVIFNSQTPIGTAQAVYMSGVAEMLTGVDRDRGIEVFSRGANVQGARNWTADRVQPPARLRLFRATVSQHSILCPMNYPEPCPIHGRTEDHRVEVDLQG